MDRSIGRGAAVGAEGQGDAQNAEHESNEQRQCDAKESHLSRMP